jgi:uncharacterized OsmC-like protein
MTTITTAYKGDMLFQTTIGGHTVSVDVPSSMGGKERGVTPPDLFIASLSSCIGAFVAAYCRDHDIDPDDMIVSMSFDKADNPIRLTNIKARVDLPHASLGKRESAAKRAALHCPVHETIKAFGGIELEVVDKPNGASRD